MTVPKESASLFNELTQMLSDAAGQGFFTGAAVDVRHLEGSPIQVFYGNHGDAVEKSVDSKSFFDLASLTKVLFPVTYLATKYTGEGFVDVDIKGEISELPWAEAWQEVRLEDVLSHQAGFEAWLDFFQQLFDGDTRKWQSHRDHVREMILERIVKSGPSYEPRSKVEYSDLGFIILGNWMEKRFQADLNELWAKTISTLSNSKELLFNPLDSGCPKEKILATEEIDWRGGGVQGEVHDNNAFLLDGISCHAGLFGTLDATSEMAIHWLRGYYGQSNALKEESVKAFVERRTRSDLEPRSLGWMRPSRPFSTGGKNISDESIGHLGYSGTSIWIDLERKVQVVLLTNRVHGSFSSKDMNRFRSEVHDLVWGAFS